MGFAAGAPGRLGAGCTLGLSGSYPGGVGAHGPGAVFSRSAQPQAGHRAKGTWVCRCFTGRAAARGERPTLRGSEWRGRKALPHFRFCVVQQGRPRPLRSGVTRDHTAGAGGRNETAQLLRAMGRGSVQCLHHGCHGGSGMLSLHSGEAGLVGPELASSSVQCPVPLPPCTPEICGKQGCVSTFPAYHGGR